MQLPAAAPPASVARAFHALSDPSRVAILRQLGRGECCVCDITDALDLTQPLLSFHLKVLRESGLVTTRKDGRWAWYALAPEGLKSLKTWLERLEVTARRVLPVTEDGCCG